MKTKPNNNFDAIVIGSGISGGWAAKELAEKGLSVLVLERGKEMRHGLDYTGEHVPTWDLPFNGKPDRELESRDYAIQSQSYAFMASNIQFWNNDRLNPYQNNPEKPFTWTRGDHVGGRSLMWGRQSYRFSEQDFNANAKDGHGKPWPVTYQEIAPWYSHVEKFIGVNGKKEGLPQLPDGDFQKPMPWYHLEKEIQKKLKAARPDITLTNARTAILTENLPGRSACHYCGPCENGCSTGSYFSSQSSTLPAALATGNVTIRANALVERLEYDNNTQKISQVCVVDTKTNERSQYSAKVVFLCASTIASTQLLLNSANEHFPTGLANSSGVLGHYLMDHFSGIGAAGLFTNYSNYYYHGNRPTGLYVPRFRNLSNDEDLGFVRGYGFQTNTSRSSWIGSFNAPGIGAEYKNNLTQPKHWTFYVGGFGECLPQKRNKLYLTNKKDRFGVPQVAFDFEWSDNEKAMAKDIKQQAKDIVTKAGASFSVEFGDDENLSTPGAAIHEMGTARMGHNPNQSVLNKYNQAHDINNLFITDGSFMASSACVNPSLTYMAFTARACDYAVKQLKSGNI
ncbi:GMC family oxidoreductase [Halioxenophilus aromaticivorans]|uniref:GMC family oxidoreductase n=1 Tax=Halioxenophilus aromaticivorans TaxID=1306992 RepID=A0AAV3UB19_9ALTE